MLISICASVRKPFLWAFIGLMLLLSFGSSAKAEVFDPYKKSLPMFDEDYYADCKLKHIKPGMDARSINSIESACMRKATPRRCRDIKTTAISTGECVTECKEAGFWSNKFGDCAKD
jgi:hypothetical protein